MEGTAKLLTTFMRNMLVSSPLSRLGTLFLLPSLRQLKQKLDPKRYNGAMFLGIDGVCVKSHGTDAEGFANAIKVAVEMITDRLNESIRKTFPRFRKCQRTKTIGRGIMVEPRSEILGFGSYLPARVVTNDDLAKFVDTSDEWIFGRTGIKQRHIAAAGEMTSDLAVKAAERALEASETRGEEVDLIVLATSTPDQTFPATATRVQAAIGMTGGAAFDVQAVCSGFIYAMATADNFIRAGQAKTALVIGADFSRILDWEDRSTCVLFGDGRNFRTRVGDGLDDGRPKNSRGVISTHLHSDGRFSDILYVDGGPSRRGPSDT